MRPQTELAQTIPSYNQEVDAMAATGRKGDTMMAHVTPGDYVIPKDILVKHPEFLVRLKKVMSQENEDYRTHMVGSGFENINPATNAPEFGFGKSFKGWTRTLIGKPLSSAGNALGESTRGIPLVGPLIGGVGAAGSEVFDIASPSKQILGSEGFFGGVESGATGKPNYYDVKKPLPEQSLESYSPDVMNLPSSMKELGGLSDEQKRAYLASQGAYGEGLGGSSKDYYINLLQRNIAAGQGNLLPAETQYLSSMGVNTGLTGKDLITALRGV